MTVTGKINFEPAGDGPLPPPPKQPEPCPEKEPVSISIKTDDGCNKCDSCGKAVTADKK